MAAEVAGRIRETLDYPVPDPPTEDFVSGTSGLVFGIRATGRAVVADALADARSASRGVPWRLRRAAREGARRRVLALGIERPDEVNLLDAAWRELRSSRHEVHLDSTVTGDRGKFENLNALLARNPVEDYDWLLAVDDDVALPGGFLDAFLFLVERFGLQLAQPAHRARSHAAWEVTRRRPGSVVRETSVRRDRPAGRVRARPRSTRCCRSRSSGSGGGWTRTGGALARQHSWRLGVVDATPITHGITEGGRGVRPRGRDRGGDAGSSRAAVRACVRGAADAGHPPLVVMSSR